MLILRPSEILEFCKCPRSYYLKYVIKAAPLKGSPNLVFGTVLHKAIEAYLKEEILPQEMENFFKETWESELLEYDLQEAGRYSLNDLLEIGKKLVIQFPSAWRETGLIPLIDDKGFVMERRFEVKINEQIVLSGTPDILCLNETGEVVVLDFKTASSPAMDGFVLLSDQLQAYALLVNAHAQELGIDKIAKIGFMEFIKKKTPEIRQPILVDAVISGEFIKKIKWVGENILNKNFFANPLMAWNSPCRMCDFKNYCMYGSTEGLYMPERSLHNNFMKKN